MVLVVCMLQCLCYTNTAAEWQSCIIPVRHEFTQTHGGVACFLIASLLFLMIDCCQEKQLMS